MISLLLSTGARPHVVPTPENLNGREAPTGNPHWQQICASGLQDTRSNALERVQLLLPPCRAFPLLNSDTTPPGTDAPAQRSVPPPRGRRCQTSLPCMRPVIKECFKRRNFVPLPSLFLRLYNLLQLLRQHRDSIPTTQLHDRIHPRATCRVLPRFHPNHLRAVMPAFFSYQIVTRPSIGP